MDLYRWQRQCLKAWDAHDCRGIVHVATGAGKTVLAIRTMELWMQRHPNAMVKIVVPTIPLAHQWERALLQQVEAEDMRPGFYGGGSRDSERRVMIYIVNSARGALSGHVRRALSMGRHVLLVCDECHHCQSPENRRIFGFLTPEVLSGGQYASLGLSATPFGTENDGLLVRALGPEIYRYGFDEAVREGILTPFVVCDVGVSFYPEEREEYQYLSREIQKALALLNLEHPKLSALDRNAFMRAVGRLAAAAGMDSDDPAARFLRLTYQRKRVSNLARCRVACGLELLRRLPGESRVLVFCERIEQAVDMAAAIRMRMGGICALYHSEMTAEARARSMEAFRDGRARVLVSCRCLDEGIDVPDASIGMVLSSSSMSRQRIQRMGRILRRAPDKAASCLYYIYVREASDDAVYLPGLTQCERFSLQYSTLENAFANELYEYAANELLNRARNRGWEAERLRELRRCLLEGIVRPDYLLPENALRSRISGAANLRERNYYRTMTAMSRAFHDGEETGETP